MKEEAFLWDYFPFCEIRDNSIDDLAYNIDGEYCKQLNNIEISLFEESKIIKIWMRASSFSFTMRWFVLAFAINLI